MSKTPITYYRKTEEILNVITHGIGILLSLAGFVWLMIESIKQGSIWSIMSSTIYGISLILLYTASTSYHMSYKKNVRRILNKLDHGAIYLLIAGTYTPFCLIALRDNVGWWLFISIWTLAIAGVFFKWKYAGRFDKLSTLLYVLMGWLVVFTFRPLIDSVSSTILTYMILGGASYTLGAIFYLLKKMKYHHAIFHLWVLGGSVFHFIAIYYLI